MSDYKLTLQSHNSDLQELINIANELPDKVEGVQLNFEVVGGTEEPTNPTENMIWINTDQAITSWLFSATQPTTPAQGMVWICVDKASSAEFNILEINGIQVYPICAKQYVNDAWIHKMAKSYLDSKWVEWAVHLYDKGNQFVDITGGWKSYVGFNTNKVTFNIDNVTVYGNFTYSVHGATALTYTANKINLTGFSKLTMKVTNVSYNSNIQCGIMVNNNLNCVGSESNSINYNTLSKFAASAAATANGEITVDISNLQGEYYIFIGVLYGTANGTSQLTCSEVRLLC